MAEAKHGTSPIVLEETPGKKAYCWCGHSDKVPYCDGSHAREQVGVGPVVVEVTEPGKKAVCQCHRTGNQPWCDGSHARPA